jgi:hypothetical protein
MKVNVNISSDAIKLFRRDPFELPIDQSNEYPAIIR